MCGNRRAQLFALDLMLAMIPITIILGISATAMAGVSTQMQEYIYGYSLQRITLDAADVLVKNPGQPYNWDNDTTTLLTLGFASVFQTVTPPGTPSHTIDISKVLALNQSSGSDEVKESLRYLAGGNNIRLSLYINPNGTKIANISEESLSRILDIAGYGNNSVWTTSNDSTAIDAEIANGKSVYVQERVAIFGYIPYGSLGVSGMENISTAGQGGWDTFPGTFDIDNPFETSDYYVLIYYTSDPPAGTPHSFKNLFLNGQELTSTYSYPSMDPDNNKPYKIDSNDTGLLIPLDYSLIAESNTISISIAGNVQETLAATFLIIPKDMTPSQFQEFTDLAIALRFNYVLIKVVIWT